MVTISPRFLNANATISVAGNLQDLRELADRDEFVDANGLPLALGLGGTRRLELFARAAAHVARAPARRRAAQRGHRLRDVRIHRFLIDRSALALLATTAAIGDAAGGATAATLTTATAACRHHHRRRRHHRRRLDGDRRDAPSPGPPPGAADAIGRGGNPPLLATGRGRGAPGVTGRGRGRSGVAGCECAVGAGRGPSLAGAGARHFGLARLRASARSARDRRGGCFGLRARRFFGAHALRCASASTRACFRGDRFLLGGVRRGGFGGGGGDGRLLFGGGLHVGGLATTTDRFAGRRQRRPPARAPARDAGAVRRRRAVGAGAACFSARARFSRSQRARMRATWSSVSILMWLRTGMSICRRSVTTSSADTANSFANSLTESLLKHPPHVPLDGSP